MRLWQEAGIKVKLQNDRYSQCAQRSAESTSLSCNNMFKLLLLTIISNQSALPPWTLTSNRLFIHRNTPLWIPSLGEGGSSIRLKVKTMICHYSLTILFHIIPPYSTIKWVWLKTSSLFLGQHSRLSVCYFVFLVAGMGPNSFALWRDSCRTA